MFYAVICTDGQMPSPDNKITKIILKISNLPQKSLKTNRNERDKMNGTTVKLLFAAGALMLLAGVIFAFMRLWVIAGLMGAASLGCLAGALNFRDHGDKNS